MESAQQISFELLLEIPNCEIYSVQMQLKPPQKRLIQQGNLQAIFNTQMKLYVLQVEDFKYSLSPEIPTARNSPGQFMLPGMDDEIYALIVQQPFDQEAVSCLEDFIDEHSNLVVQKQEFSQQVQQEEQVRYQEIEQQLQQGIQQNAQANVQGNLQMQVVQPQEEEKLNKTQKAKKWLQKAGEKAKYYIGVGAQKSAIYINKGVVYAKKKIKQKEQPTQISQGTKQKVAAAKSGAKLVYSMTSTAVKGLIAAGEAIVKEINVKFDKSEKGQKLQKNKNYQSAKEVTKATINFVAVTYDALFDAAVFMTKEIGTGVVQIVDHRYGKEAAQVTSDGLQSAGSVALIFRDTRQQIAKCIAKGTEDEEQKKALENKDQVNQIKN